MDHVLSPTSWKGEDYSDAAFLESARLPSAVREGVVDIRLLERAAYEALPAAARRAVLPLGASDDEARQLLQPLVATPVLRVPHARRLLCGFSSATAVTEFNSRADALLAVPSWCAKCYSQCNTQLAKWLSAEQLRGVRGNFYCLQVPRPPHFQHGKCVPNL